jgi:hypothetical protein
MVNVAEIWNYQTNFSGSLRYQMLTSVERFMGYMKITNLWPYVNRALLQINMANNRNCSYNDSGCLISNLKYICLMV